MLDRALHALPLLGFAASALAISGCPGDDVSGSGTASAPGSTTDPGSTETGGPVTATDDTTGSDTTVTGETGDSTSTTGNPLECPYDEVEGSPPVTFELVGNGFDRPILAIGHPTEPDRLFVVEQGGNVRILEPGQTTAPASAFLTVDVRGANNNTIGPEFGLLGFAFHPDFPADPRVYINYNPPRGGGSPMHTVVSEFTVDANDPDQVDPASERVILDLHQPADNHNGGMIAFGGDGYLYIGMGDGGGGGDTFNTGRAPQYVLAKVLRIGVEPDGSPDDPQSCEGCPQYGPFDYTIPDDNPFVADAAFAPEIYAWGVRNPWRFARDPETELIYAGDVGQGNREEVTLISSGADLGWSTMEGFSCFDGPCAPAAGPNEINGDGMTMPLVDYGHGGGRCSVTGLSVYRSCEVPGWDGVYFYADYCSRDVYALFWDGTTVQDLGEVFTHNESITGNGWNAYGDVFVTTVDAIFGLPIEDGLVYRIAPG